MSADFLAKRTFFVFLLGKIRPHQMLGSRCFINGRIKRRSGERFPWHCHLPACFNKIKKTLALVNRMLNLLTFFKFSL